MIKQKLFEFNRLQRTDDEVTPRAGLILFDGFMKAMRIGKIINDNMPLPGSNRGYSAWQYTRTLCLLQYGGGRHIADLREIREDKVLQEATGLKVIPSDSAVGDWILRQGKRDGTDGIDKVIQEAVIKILKMDKDNEEYTLWVDPTIIDLADKDYAEVLYTGQSGDRPIVAGLKELPIFVYQKYRKGNAMGGTKEAVENGFEAVEAAGKKIKHVALDSEFYNAEVIKFIKQKGATFTIVADKNIAVKELIKRIAEKDWRPFYDADGLKTSRQIAVTIHAMNETEAFSLVVLRWKKEQLNLLEPDIYFYHAIATNLQVDADAVINIHKESIPEPCRVLWRYNERGQIENHIKELKIGIGMEHMPFGEFEANAIYFGIGVLTYNLMIAQKHFVVMEGYQGSTINTLRWRFTQISAWIVEHAKIVRLKIATTVEKYEHYLRMIKRMEAIKMLPY